MKIKIYTYADPYHIDEEQYWDEIKNVAHFCVSQTMVNGMSLIYPHFKEQNQITTVRRLINALYKDWESDNVKVKQIMEVDNAISKLHAGKPLGENIRRSLLFNTKSIVNCFRIFKELGLNSNELSKDNLNSDQQIIVDLYDLICNKGSSSFDFVRVDDAQKIEQSLEECLKGDDGSLDVSNVDFDTIVIHGVHQFSPAMLCAIEDISKVKNIVLLFNYQEQYKSVYDTWLNIYSLFDLPISTHSENQFEPSPLYIDSYKSNLLGEFIGRVSDGNYSDFNEELADIEILEFENNTEFANYCAKIYENARREAEKSGDKTTLAHMSEQFYSSSKKVNDILRAYFPEQFGERHFLDYPIGHFFVATMNMWDEDAKAAIVDNFSDLKECLQSGIISEKKKGQLLNTFNNVVSYFEDQRYLEDIIARLRNLKKYVNKAIPDRERIGYFNTSKEELEDLISGLEELNTIEKSFFLDFSDNGGSFKNFYNRIQKFIISKLSDIGDLDQEMTIVIKKLLAKLENSDLPDTGTYTTLKQTMSFYLSQDDSVGRSAHWIVRGFEQIDGDILRSSQQDPKQTTYHFCCLSDKDICASNDGRLPWPLDIKFFEYAHAPIDLKYQIFLKSKMEYKNFNRYALLYGLEFNRIGFKLSYVKNENDKDNDLYHLIELLKPRIKKYKSFASSVAKPPLKTGLQNKPLSLTSIDRVKISLCPYRFALESIVQGKTIFRSRFLIHHYMRIIIDFNVAYSLQGTSFSDPIVHKTILSEYESVSDQFKLSDELEKTQLVASVFKDLKKNYVYKNKFLPFHHETYDNFNKQKDFLYINLKDLCLLSDSDIEKIFADNDFSTAKGSYCKFCASKDICLENRD